jgi:hypothetical protein
MAAREVCDFYPGDRGAEMAQMSWYGCKPNGVAGLARLAVAAGLQRGHGRGASPSNPSIRVRSSH